jgi:hypothetical protein
MASSRKRRKYQHGVISENGGNGISGKHQRHGIFFFFFSFFQAKIFEIAPSAFFFWRQNNIEK